MDVQVADIVPDRVLTSEELAIIHDEQDRRIVAKIKMMDCDEFNRLHSYYPIDQKHYNGLQNEWIFGTGRYLLGTRINRCPSEDEAIEDYCAHKTPAFFRVFYVEKYPHLVKSPEEFEKYIAEKNSRRE